MSRFTTINPFNPTDAGDAETVYYNGQLMCKDSTQPLAKYIDAQDIPILKDVGKFSVLLTQLELNNMTPQLPVYEVEIDNFTETIAWTDNTLIGGSSYTIFPGYTYTNAWYARPHKLMPSTFFSMTFYDGSSAPLLSLNTSSLIGNTLQYFNTVITPPTAPNNGLITDVTIGASADINYFNISSDGLHIIIIADNIVGSAGGDTMDITVYGQLYTGLSLTNITPLYSTLVSTKYIYTFDLGTELTPIIPKAELAYGSYTALNALKLRFFLNADIYKNQPTYSFSYSNSSIRTELPQTQCFTRVPLINLDVIISQKFPTTKAVFYQMSDLMNSINGGFQGFFNLLNGEMALQSLLINGSVPTTLPYVSTTASFIKYDYATNQLKLYLDPYGFINFSGGGGDLGISGGTATPTSITNIVPQSTGIYEIEQFQLYMNADFKSLLSGFATFTNLGSVENFLLLPADYIVEPFQSSITGLPLILDTQVLYALNNVMLGDPTTFPDFITQGTTVCLLTVHMSPSVSTGWTIGEVYYVQYTAGIFTNSVNVKNAEDLNGYYKLQSVNIDSNSLTFEVNAQFWRSLPFVGTSYYQADSGFTMSGSVYKPVSYTYPFNISRTADPIPLLQGRYKECVNMVIKSDINKFNLTMSTVDALVITTTNIPIQKEYNTKVMTTETNNLGNNTNKGTFLNILYTLNLPYGSKDSVITLPMIPEHKKNYMMTLNTELKVIDLQFWWKNRLTNELTPLVMPQNSSILFKLRFRKELK
jgi:hypothetical protein